jgi:hypothetical protein
MGHSSRFWPRHRYLNHDVARFRFNEMSQNPQGTIGKPGHEGYTDEEPDEEEHADMATFEWNAIALLSRASSAIASRRHLGFLLPTRNRVAFLHKFCIRCGTEAESQRQVGDHGGKRGERCIERRAA